MKRMLYSTVASVAMLIAFTGIYPASWMLWYEPEMPEELKM